MLTHTLQIGRNWKYWNWIWKLSIILRIHRTFHQLIIICFGIWISVWKEKYFISNRLSKMPSALSSFSLSRLLCKRHKWSTIEMAKVYRCLRSILWVIEMLFYSKNNKANFWIRTFNFILNAVLPGGQNINLQLYPIFLLIFVNNVEKFL